MVRKRRGGPGGPASPSLLLLFLFLGVTSGYRKVGCVFSKTVCKPDIEVCYDDNAFGRCLRLDEDLSEKDSYQYEMTPEELDLLRVELERLEYLGYKWSDDYTQCAMQVLLDDVRYRTNSDVEELCSDLRLRGDVPYDEENQLVDISDNTGGLTVEEPQAVVKFTPSRMEPHGDYADEFYYPSEVGQRMAEERRRKEAAVGYDDYKKPVSGYFGKLNAPGDPVAAAAYRRDSRSLRKPSLGQMVQAEVYSKENYPIPREYVDALRDYLETRTTSGDGEPDDLEFIPVNDKKPLSSLNNDDDDDGEEEENYEKAFSRKYKQPSDFLGPRADTSDQDDDDEEEEEEDDVKDYDEGHVGEPVGYSKPLGSGRRQQSKDYADFSFEDFLWGRDSKGFKRRERLDVKKPGPLFSTNNFAFKTQAPPTSHLESNDAGDDGQDVNQVMYSPVKKEVKNKLESSISTSYENVDLDHVYVQFKQDINSWPEGNKIVQSVGELIGLKPSELNGIRVGRAEVTFKVSKNSKGYNATDVVRMIDGIRGDLKKQLQVDVIRAGIGDKTKLPAMLDVSSARPEVAPSMFGALVGASVAAACAAAVVILFIAWRHAKSRAKLAGLRTPDPEASKDYQELCRARMAAKQPDKPSDSPKGFDFGRLIESGRSDSRSSTSSWSEEPPTTNIDVATGHLVLSYMEEHLKNQERLDEEWAALVAYEPEPCSTAVAEGNADRNRVGAALPYDHSRVVLNDLANLKSSDYINASTITDHDPRNPAYIATQGPLPQTTADFWQLVWEQGSVVIVMLSRLTEEGQAMCHRYWPDEGSEIYHIYEIHIVSEHIWCDDYLVRSFYLKNLRTSETRTVTQFHFLSWPNNSVPKSTKTLLEFRRKVNKSYRGRSCPIIVHCSDGAGRTGTYCLIDMLLNRMSKGAKDIDLATTLEHIRDQRPGMVATKQQFEFVLMAVAEEVHAILKTLPAVAAADDKSTAAAAATDKQPTKSDK